MPRFDVVTVGGVVQDITFYTDKCKIINTPEDLTSQKLIAFEYGAKIKPTAAYLNLGGGAANAAVALARLGVKTAMISQVGDDHAAEEVINKLRTEGVSTAYLSTDRQSVTGFSVIIAQDSKDHEHVAFTYRGADETFVFKPQRYAALQPKWLYLTSLSGRFWVRNLKIIFDFAKRKRAKVIWNPGSYQLQSGKRGLASYLKQTDVLILNKDEAIELVLSGIKLGRKNPSHLNKPLYLASILQEWGPKMVVITEGAKGTSAFDGKKLYFQPAVKTKKMVDTTGVGDAFGATFLAALTGPTPDIPTALKWAATNSSAVTTEVGAQNGLLSKKKLLDRIK